MKLVNFVQKFCDEFVVSSSNILGKTISQGTIEICWQDIANDRAIKFVSIDRVNGTYSEITTKQGEKR